MTSVGWKWKTARSGAAKNVFTKASARRKMRVLPVKVRCLGTNTEGCVSEQGILFWETVVLTGESSDNQSNSVMKRLMWSLYLLTWEHWVGIWYVYYFWFSNDYSCWWNTACSSSTNISSSMLKIRGEGRTGTFLKWLGTMYFNEILKDFDLVSLTRKSFDLSKVTGL